MRDYALNLAASAEATGSHALLWDLIRNWRSRRAVSRLDRLDDHLLRDIGVTREELRWATRLPLSRNAALELDDLARRRRRGA